MAIVNKKERDSQIENFYQSEYKNLFRYVCQIVGNVDDAMEVVQETFLNFYRLQNDEATCKCDRGILFYMARNHAIDLLRRSRTRETYRREIQEGNIVVFNPAHTKTPEEILLDQERKICVKLAIDQLSKKEQECLALRRWGLSYREVAQAMHINSQSVGQVITRALRKFRGVYAQVLEKKESSRENRTARR